MVVTGAKVAAATLTKYSACVACNSKLEATQFSDDIAQCTKCVWDATVICNDHISANLLLNVAYDYIQISAFDNTLQEIVGEGNNITIPALLTAMPFTANLESKNEIQEGKNEIHLAPPLLFKEFFHLLVYISSARLGHD